MGWGEWERRYTCTVLVQYSDYGSGAQLSHTPLRTPNFQFFFVLWQVITVFDTHVPGTGPVASTPFCSQSDNHALGYRPPP